MKIVSLLPSATEIVAALGLAENLVGRSHECDWPTELDHLPVLTQPKMNPLENAATIDRDVRALVEDGTSVYKLDADAIRAIAPDVVITQSQCELCAVSVGEAETALQDWVGATRPKLVSLEPMRLADLAEDITKTGAALDAEQQADRLNGDMAEGFAALRATTETLPRKKVFFMEWTTPFMGAGNWMPETIAAAELDVILVGPCGFSMERARQEMAALQDNKDWQNLCAVKAGEVYLVNGNHFFNRPGPRLLQSAEIVAEILHPHIFAAANHGTGWLRHA